MRSMPKLALCLVLSPAMSMADEAPPVPEGGLSFFYQSPCADSETGQKGYCFLGRDQTGQTFLTFWQEEELMFIRQVTGDTYETIWVNPKYNSV